MKITQLRIKNLNSLKEEHVIPFNQAPLSETGLFAITGPTGAGKSTLLDAISLALYNQIPRSGKLSRNNIENFGTLITRGTSDCYAEVEYQVNGNSYRSKWSISRNRNHNLRDYEMELSQLNPDGEWDILEQAKRLIPGRNAEITGLNYDQFVKSIVLSQGEFAKFLKANANERSELLEKITGTEIYRQIGKAAYAKLKEQEDFIAAINNKMQGIELLSPEDKTSIEGNAKTLKQELENLEMQIKITKEQVSVRKQEAEWKLSLDKNKTDEEELRKEITAFTPLLQQLEQHNKLIHSKGDLQQNIQQELQIKQLKKQIEEYKAEIEKKKKELEQSKEQLKNDLENEKTVVKEREQLRPILSKVSQLDEQLKMLANQVKERKAELDLAVRTNKELKTKQEQYNFDLKGCGKSKEEIEKILERDKALEEVPVLLPLVNQQLDQIKRTYSKLEEEAAALKSTELRDQIRKGSNWAQKIDLLQVKIDDVKAQLIPIEKELEKANFTNREELNQQLTQASRKSKSLEQLESLQKYYLKDHQENKELHLQLKANNRSIELAANLLKDQKPKLKVLELKEEEVSIRLQRLQLESSLEDKREQLVAGEACPLCGSTHHPYVKSYENKSEESKKEKQQLQTELKKLASEIETKQKELILLEADNKSILNRLEKVKILLNENSKAFEEEQLKIKTELTVMDQDALKIIAGEHKIWARQIELSAKNFDSRENMLQNLQVMAPLLEKVKLIAEAQEQSEASLCNLQHFIQNETNLKSKLEALHALHLGYQNKKEELLHQDKNILRLNELIKAGLENIQIANKDAEQKTANLNKLAKNKLDVEQERKLLLGDKLPAEEQEKIDKKLELASAKLQDSSKKEVSIKQNITYLQEQTDKETKNASKLEIAYAEEFKRLLALVQKHSFDSLELAMNAILPEGKAAEIKNRQDALQNRETARKQSEKDLQEALAKIKLKLTAIATEELLEKEKQEDAQLGDANKSLGAFEQQLKQDKENRKRAGSLLTELEVQRKEVKRWANLNELIGDATGNKYSKFAQELTLQQMLSLANLHLMKLDQRYLLKYNPQQNEDLFVVDTLQGNEERSVRTLSGGESFLISLALALGLSDLAGQNTQLETLFIDEGFGSLDQVTLELALCTLERLQAESNRTIGIISHVEALKERISTQIELVKDSAGNSHIEIR
ncbi:AAA family ATPase [Labilibaculum antarcticum]|uniref:Rad50/SbcC-type AAA domain-containing protein n=1 Tax=Labilibaculum antarcticum TaxID=1717717 RepID=A0A1Y1CR48_9BACT|nr:AAA family ATPase [Labilibaculum antarcticum]BAX82463.1 hypothetical protein ALGA_4172 [Labilibaculum antarcticum]